MFFFSKVFKKKDQRKNVLQVSFKQLHQNSAFNMLYKKNVYLFRQYTNTDKKREVVVFVTISDLKPHSRHAKNFRVYSEPPYSLDLLPCDYHMCDALKEELGGHSFDDTAVMFEFNCPPSFVDNVTKNCLSAGIAKNGLYSFVQIII